MKSARRGRGTPPGDYGPARRRPGPRPPGCRGASHRVRRDRGARCEAFEQHQPEGVGQQREHQLGGGGVGLRQRHVVPLADKVRRRVIADQGFALQPVVDDELRARQVEREEGAQVLLDRDPADIQEHRARIRHVGPQVRAEAREVHAAGPGAHVAEPASGQFAPQAGGRDHHRRARIMEPAQPGVGQSDRQLRPRVQILGEARVERRGGGHAAPQRPAPGGMAQRTLGRDVQRVGAKRIDHGCKPARGRQRDPDAGVGRQRHSAEPVGPDHLDEVAHGGQLRRHHRQGTDNAVDLRAPSVRDD